MMLVYVSKLDFQANLCEAFAKVKKAALLWKLRFGMGSFTKDSQTISEQDFTQNVGEVSSSIYLAVYWAIAQNVGSWLGNKDKIYICSHLL